MSAYILYDTRSGQVLAIHHEVTIDDEAVSLTADEIVEAVGESVVDGADFAVLEVDERPPIRRGYRLVVDPNMEQLIEREVS
jgi:hypothetical protein